ncbi:MAG TPA: DUF2061 domain-containing protein [Chryseolinea sp.]
MFLTNRNTMDSHTRSVVKGVSWRIVGTIDTIILSFIVTGNIGNALKIGFTEVFTKIFLYYLHERIWNTTSFGRTSDKKPSHLRSLLKGISWRAVGTLDTMFIAYFITGVPLDALKIGGFEVFTKVAFFYIHERIWSGIKWGRGVAVVEPEKVEVRETTLQS